MSLLQAIRMDCAQLGELSVADPFFTPTMFVHLIIPNDNEAAELKLHLHTTKKPTNRQLMDRDFLNQIVHEVENFFRALEQFQSFGEYVPWCLEFFDKPATRVPLGPRN
ncbi:hypothetical protein LUCX_222 [Xanthomonas phage vB_XciM_LucasX]|nr:hypothetical protein LUCX_222 [Xanthomonas phage vB_XciM_LucasX]